MKNALILLIIKLINVGRARISWFGALNKCYNSDNSLT